MHNYFGSQVVVVATHQLASYLTIMMPSLDENSSLRSTHWIAALCFVLYQDPANSIICLHLRNRGRSQAVKNQDVLGKWYCFHLLSHRIETLWEMRECTKISHGNLIHVQDKSLKVFTKSKRRARQTYQLFRIDFPEKCRCTADQKAQF